MTVSKEQDSDMAHPVSTGGQTQDVVSPDTRLVFHILHRVCRLEFTDTFFTQLEPTGPVD